MLHKSMTVEKWALYGTTRQILMIANELNRARRACEKNQTELKTDALMRAIELIDLSVSTSARRSFRREMLRFGEVVRGLTRENIADSICVALKVVLSFDKVSYSQIFAMGLR